LLREELERRRVIAVFSRLHPLIEQEHVLGGLGEIRRAGLTVSVDLTVPEDEQWAGYNKQLRRLVRRGLADGVTCVRDDALVHLREWASIYDETMERVEASPQYRFDAAYFARMAEELGPSLRLFMAFVDGQPAAGGLFTICDGIVQAHLGGSRDDFHDYAVVRVVDDTARRWAARAGARVFHLGGGVGGRQDSLFQYKATFSDRRHTFATWRWVVDRDAYERLSRERAAKNVAAVGADADAGFFPAYRDRDDLPMRRQSPRPSTRPSRS
jgi:hypothetical protein